MTSDVVELNRSPKAGDFSPSSVPASRRPVSSEAEASDQSLPLHRLNVRQNLPYQPDCAPSSEEPDLQRSSSGLKPSARKPELTSSLLTQQDQQRAENSRLLAAVPTPAPKPPLISVERQREIGEWSRSVSQRITDLLYVGVDAVVAERTASQDDEIAALRARVDRLERLLTPREIEGDE
jgi:hypothetical protein